MQAHHFKFLCPNGSWHDSDKACHVAMDIWTQQHLAIELEIWKSTKSFKRVSKSLNLNSHVKESQILSAFMHPFAIVFFFYKYPFVVMCVPLFKHTCIFIEDVCSTCTLEGWHENSTTYHRAIIHLFYLWRILFQVIIHSCIATLYLIVLSVNVSLSSIVYARPAFSSPLTPIYICIDIWNKWQFPFPYP